MTIKVEDRIKFEHYFFIQYTKFDEDRRELNEWLKEHCTGQWLIGSSYSSYGIYSQPKHTSPIDAQYIPSYVNMKDCIMLMFEDDSDASLFKLTFMGEK